MKRGELEFVVPRPVAAVWEVVADLELVPRWSPAVVSMTRRDGGAPGVGTVFDQVIELQGQRAEAELEITAWEPPRRLAHRARGGPGTFTAEFELAEDGSRERTRVRHAYTLALEGMMRVMEPVIAPMVRQTTEQGVANLRRLLEGGA